MANTINYGLEKPIYGTPNYNVPLNSNFDIIDTEIKNRANSINTINTQLDNVINNQYKQITSHCMIYDNLSDGTDTGVTYRHYYVATVSSYDIKFVYGNFYIPSTQPITDTFTPNDITIKASLEIGENIYPVKFNGYDSIILKPGAVIETDAIGVELNAGDIFRIRTYVSVASAGMKFPMGMGVFWNFGEGKTTGDITVSGTPEGSAEYTYHPLAIVGNGVKKSVLLSGDSIFTNVTGTTIAITGGYAGLGLDGEIPYAGISRSNDQAGYFTNIAKQCRIKLSKYFTHVIINYGINDLYGGRTLSEIQTLLTNIWNMYALRGLKVYQCTITPRTTSTDGWTTVENQTIEDTNINSIRVQLNDWIRTCPTPLTDYFEAADLAETSRNSGIWKVGLTEDGLHPSSTTGHTALSASIDLSKLT